MSTLRWIFVAVLLAVLLYCAARAPWIGTFVRAQSTFHIDLGRAPVWSPPAVPAHQDFARVFTGSANFGTAQGPSSDYGRSLKLDLFVFETALLVWPVALVAGLSYLIVRGKRNDLVLHAALWTAVGLTLTAVLSVGTWMLLGGWGPPILPCLPVGLAVGWSVGLITYFARWFKLNSAPARVVERSVDV